MLQLFVFVTQSKLFKFYYEYKQNKKSKFCIYTYSLHSPILLLTHSLCLYIWF